MEFLGGGGVTATPPICIIYIIEFTNGVLTELHYLQLFQHLRSKGVNFFKILQKTSYAVWFYL